MVVPDALSQAKRLIGRDPAAALEAAQHAHASRPTAETRLLLATAARRAGRPAMAVALLEPLAKAAPQAWGVAFELGLARAATGDTAGGIAALEHAASLNPEASRLRWALHDLRIVSDVAASPPAPPPASVRAAVEAALLDRPGAGDAMLRDFGLATDDIAISGLVADVGLAAGVAEAVAGVLARALLMTPGYAPLRYRLAEALHRIERDRKALDTLAPLCAPAPSMAVRALRGAILMRLGREEEAEADFAAVAAARSGDAHAALVHGHALRALGRRDAAIAEYRRAIALRRDMAEAWWSIADLKVGAFAADDIDRMEGLAAAPGLPPEARSHVRFALGRAHEDAGHHDRAFACYTEANAIRREIEPHDDSRHDAFLRATIETMDADFFASRTGTGYEGAAPIFVLGMPRSGSTLVERILSAHSRIEGLSELPDITTIARGIPLYPRGLGDLSPKALAALGAGYAASVSARQRTGAPHVIDKFPGNAFHIGLIHLILPNARIIDVRRDARDCCLSIFAQSFAAGQSYSYDLADLGRHYARYVAIMRHFDAVLPGRVLRVEYEGLVADLEGQTRRMLDHCGLAFEPATQRFFDQPGAVRTASSEQVRQPIYASSIGRWRRFEPWLAPLHESLVNSDI